MFFLKNQFINQRKLSLLCFEDYTPIKVPIKKSIVKPTGKLFAQDELLPNFIQTSSGKTDKQHEKYK